MLTIGKLGVGQERYYLDKVAEGAEDYYSGEGEVAGEWVGDAARDLGFDGEVGADQLTAMLTGRNPVDGEPLLGTNGVPAKGGVPGFDLTFSAPKSVSLLRGTGGPVAAVEVSEAHREAVQAALSYMQREACWTRRGAGGSEFVKGNGYLAAGYLHRSSRNGDPQLHTHVLIANATKGPDGRWTRLYHSGIYEHAKAAGYIYEAHLRHELARRLGVQWVRTQPEDATGVGACAHLRASPRASRFPPRLPAASLLGSRSSGRSISTVAASGVTL
ncbi:MAG TPA: MobF family relaxase [Solirubrobacterales bacterium]